MSLSQLQAATAFLVRFPERGRGSSWPSFVGQYDLTEREIAQLYHVAHNEQVVKYGKKLRRFRFVDVADALPTPEAILGKELFEKLWFDYFEPVAAGIATEDLAHDFLKFLNQDAMALALIAGEAPVYASEFLHFLYVEMSLGHRSNEWLKKPLPEGSLLNHAAICPLALYYNVPQVIQKESEAAYRKMRRATKPFYYVLLLKAGEDEPSLFAIDKSVYDFLVAQLSSPTSHDARPAVYNDLVAAGICRQP